MRRPSPTHFGIPSADVNVAPPMLSTCSFLHRHAVAAEVFGRSELNMDCLLSAIMAGHRLAMTPDFIMPLATYFNGVSKCTRLCPSLTDKAMMHEQQERPNVADC